MLLGGTQQLVHRDHNGPTIKGHDVQQSDLLFRDVIMIVLISKKMNNCVMHW